MADDATVNQFALELAEAIANAIAVDAAIGDIRKRANDAGCPFRISLEVAITFKNHKLRLLPAAGGTFEVQSAAPMRPWETTTNDRRFLRSLRIGADESPKEQVDNTGAS